MRHLAPSLLVFSALTASAVLLPAPAFADSPVVETDEGIEAQSFLTLSHHGSFRFRTDLFSHLPLVVGGDANGPAVTQTFAADEVSTGANIRFRWEPELRIGQRLRVGAQLDLMDNLVLGSTDNYSQLGSSAPLVFLDDSATDFEDALRVKALWGEWDVLGVLLLRFGRQPVHFGLGMVDNDGSCPDCDYGDWADRVSALIRAFGFHADFFFDAPGEGYIRALPGQSFGQPTDGSTSDDVVRWGFDLGYAPMDEAARAERRRALGAGEAVFDALMRHTFTSQTLASGGSAGSGDYAAAGSFDDAPLYPRDASFWVGDLYLQMKWQPRFDMALRASLEVAGMVGEARTVQNRADEPPKTSAKDFLSMGGVLQLELEHRKLTWGLEVGGASGDDVAFGANGRSFNAAIDKEYFQSEALVGNREVTSFLFDRDYHVDLLLYREAIGAVTNSVYVKPSLRAALFSSGQDTIGGQISLLYGHSLVPESVPGREAPLGFETDISVFYEATGTGRAELAAGILVPLAGLASDSQPAFALQARLGMSF